MNRIRALRPVHLALGVPWVVAIISAVQPIRDNSFLWHITAGAFQIDRGSVLTSDPFSFTRFGEPWRTQSWLADLLYSALDGRFGLAFVPWMLAVVGVLIFLGVALIAYHTSRSVATTALVGIATAWIGAAFLSPRPVLFSYLFLVLVVAVCQDRRLYWSIPLVLWVWGTVHLSFPIGLVYLALEAWRRREATLLRHTLAAGTATLFTAHGWGMVSILMEFVGNRDALGLITEWAVPDMVSVRFLPVIGGLLLFVVGAERGYVKSRHLIVVGPMLVFMFTASRAVFPAWLAIVPFLALSLKSWWRRASTGDGVATINVAIVAAIAIVPFASAGSAQLDPDTFPVELAGHLTAERVFHDDVIGGYLIYRDGGRRKVFVDDRAELYGESLFRDVIETRSGGPRWSRVLNEWRIAEALLPVGEGLVEVLKEEGWRVVGEDEHFVVLQRPL